MNQVTARNDVVFMECKGNSARFLVHVASELILFEIAFFYVWSFYHSDLLLLNQE